MRFELRFLGLIFGVAGMSILNAPNTHTADTRGPWCLSASDSNAIRFQQFLVQLGTSARENGTRMALDLPAAAADQITLVTNDSICQRLSLARDSMYAGDSTVPKQQPLYAAHYGGYYAVHVPGFYAGEWQIIHFFDTTTFQPHDAAMLW